MITKQEIFDTIAAQNVPLILEGVREIARDAGFEGPLKTVPQVVDYCMEDEEALEYVLA